VGHAGRRSRRRGGAWREVWRRPEVELLGVGGGGGAQLRRFFERADAAVRLRRLQDVGAFLVRQRVWWSALQGGGN